MRLIDRFVDEVNRHPAIVYRVQSLISKDRAVQGEIFSELLETAGVLGKDIPRVLDIASGTGHFSKIYGPRISLILSDFAIENSLYLARRWQRPVVALDASRLPFSNGAFDVVTCSAAFHHLSDDQARDVIEEVHRVLSKPGFFLLMDSYIPRKSGFWPWFFEWIERGEYLRPKTSLEDIAAHKGLFELVRVNDETERYHFKQLYLLLAKRVPA